MSFAAYGYGRASTDQQVLSTHQQEDVVKEAFEARRKRPDWADARWGGFFRDDAESAVCRVSKFRERTYGGIAIAAMKPGDVLIVSNYDRIFANVIDVAETLELFQERKLRLMILDMDIDTTTPLGDCVMKILSCIKELEWKEIRRRSRENAAYRKKVGLPTGSPPLGWRYVRVSLDGKITSRHSPDHPMRRYCQELLGLRNEGLSYRQVYWKANKLNLCSPRTGKPPSGLRAVCDAIAAAERDFVLEVHPAPIPAGAKPVKVTTIKVAS